MQTLPGHPVEDESEERQSRRRQRWAAREFLAHHSRIVRTRKCGRRRINAGAGVPVVLGESGVAHYRNVQACGSIHACPVCSPRIRSTRAAEIEQGLARHFEQGGGAGFLTLTLPHDQGDALRPLLEAVSLGFRRVLGGAGWIADREAFEVVGTIRALEVNVGANGWHPHLHVLVLTARPLADVEWAALLDRVRPRWDQAIESRGYRRPSLAHGATLTAVCSAADVAAYTAKVYDECGRDRSVGMELARHDLKQGRRGASRSPFRVLADAVENGDVADLNVWRDYEVAIRGRRAIEWSRGLKARLGVLDVTDEAIVAEEVGGEVVAVLDREQWRRLLRVRGALALVLDLAEHDADDRLSRYLASLAHLRR